MRVSKQGYLHVIITFTAPIGPKFTNSLEVTAKGQAIIIKDLKLISDYD